MATGAIIVAWVWIREGRERRKQGRFAPTSVKHKQATLGKRLSWYYHLLPLLQWRHLHFMMRSPPPCAVLRSHCTLFISLPQMITSPLFCNLPLPRAASVLLSCLPCDVSLMLQAALWHFLTFHCFPSAIILFCVLQALLLCCTFFSMLGHLVRAVGPQNVVTLLNITENSEALKCC